MYSIETAGLIRVEVHHVGAGVVLLADHPVDGPLGTLSAVDVSVEIGQPIVATLADGGTLTLPYGPVLNTLRIVQPQR
jgi:hypothetical protein